MATLLMQRDFKPSLNKLLECDGTELVKTVISWISGGFNISSILRFNSDARNKLLKLNQFHCKPFVWVARTPFLKYRC